jgi:hypothetical protein
LDAAKRLLRETKMSVVDVALDVGYANPGNSRSSSDGTLAFPQAIAVRKGDSLFRIGWGEGRGW